MRRQELDKQLGNPVHHIHRAKPEPVPGGTPPVTFGLLLNLVGVMGARCDRGAGLEPISAIMSKDARAEAQPDLARAGPACTWPITATSLPRH